MIGKRLLRWSILLIAIITIAIIVLLTPAGLRISLHLANVILPGKMSYEHASGVITGPIEISNFKYTDEKTQVSIHKLTFSWQPWGLLHRTIHVTRFTANNVHLTLLLKKSSKKSHKTNSTKPYLLNISNAHINYLSIGHTANQYPIFIRHVQLNAQIVANRVRINASAQISKPFPVSVHINATGNLNRYTICARTTGKQFSWHVYGFGNASGIFLNSKDGQTLGGKLSFHINLKWAPLLQWDFHANGIHLNFKPFDNDLPDQTSIVLLTQGAIKNDNPTFSLKTSIALPKATIKLSATRKNRLNVTWDLNIADLAKLYQPFKGSVQSQGEWQPESAIPIIKGQLQANHLSVLGYSGDSLSGIWALYPKQRRSSNFDINGIQIKAPKFQLNSIKLQGKGRQSSHQLNGNINVYGNQFAFQVQGGLINQIWKGRVQQLTIASDLYHHWQLTKPENITIAKDRAAADHLCLKTTSTTGTFCLNGNWDSQAAWQFDIKGQQFNPGLLTHFILPNLFLNSPSTLQAAISGRGTTFKTAKADIVLHKGNIHYQAEGNDIITPLQQGNIALSFTKQTLNVSSQFTFSKNNRLNASLSLPHFSNKKPKDKQVIKGKITANLGDLSPFKKAFKAITDAQGQLFVNLAISGKLASPNVQGNVALQNGSVFIPKLGITLTKIQSNIASLNQKQMNYDITAYSKDKPIHIKGNTITTPNDLKSTATIEGYNVLIMNTPEYTIYASPQFNVTLQGYTIDLTGTVNIPKGIIQPKDFANITALPSDQIVYTAGEPSVSTSTWQISANVAVSLGDDVIVNTSGFNATINGKATIIGKPKTITLANGRMNIIKGLYSAYGKTLSISPGSYIQFINSPVNNPKLNIRATKAIQITRSLADTQLGVNNIIVGIEVHGSFFSPNISFFSIPANLSQADILSYLVLGYASENTNNNNLGLLLEAANSLGGKGAGIGGAISEIKQGLGLTELGVESETIINGVGTPLDQQTSFVIGKRLTKNIYIRYSLGLGQGPFAPVNIFQLRYTLNPYWSIQTDSSTLGNGGDILYTIEAN